MRLITGRVVSLEHEGLTILRNAEKHSPSEATSQPRRLRSSVALLWEHGISRGIEKKTHTHTQGRRQRVRVPVKNFSVPPPPPPSTKGGPARRKRKQSREHLAASAFNTTHRSSVTSNILTLPRQTKKNSQYSRAPAICTVPPSWRHC